MKIDTRKKVRSVSGEHIILGQADGTTDMTRVVGFNESAMELYRRLQGRDFGLDDVVRELTDAYEVDEPTARRDAAEWVEQMRQQHLIMD